MTSRGTTGSDGTAARGPRLWRAAVLPAPRARRAVQLVTGLLLYAGSMALVLRAGLGNLPWDVLSQGLTRHLPVSFGVVTAATGVVVLLCWSRCVSGPGSGPWRTSW